MGKRDRDFELRLCRIDGRKPTARDKWKAFHRLWRLSQGHGAEQDIAAGQAFRVLFNNWRAILLLDTDRCDPLVDRSHVPTFLRKQMLDLYVRRRLYGGHPEWAERDKRVANAVRAEGIEVTPREVAEVRAKVIRLARQRAAEMDVKIPDDDEDLLRLLKPRPGED